MNTIVIGCDDAAFSMKHTIIDMLKSLQMTVEDVGCFQENDHTVYPIIAERAAKAFWQATAKKGEF